MVSCLQMSAQNNKVLLGISPPPLFWGSWHRCRFMGNMNMASRSNSSDIEFFTSASDLSLIHDLALISSCERLNLLDWLCPTDYEKRKTEEIPKALEEYLNYLARTGDTLFVWSKIKWLVRHKLELVIGSFKEACPTENLPPCPNVEPFHYETMRDKILEQFDSFTW